MLVLLARILLLVEDSKLNCSFIATTQSRCSVSEVDYDNREQERAHM